MADREVMSICRPQLHPSVCLGVSGVCMIGSVLRREIGASLLLYHARMCACRWWTVGGMEKDNPS